jgi:Peptidase M15
MFVSRITKAWRLASLALAAVAVIVVNGLASSPVRADNLPFWEQADVDAKKAQASKKSYSKSQAPKKSYAKSSEGKKIAKKSYANKGGKKLGGYAEATEPKVRKNKGVKVAALGNSYYPEPKAKKSLSGGGVSWVATSGCLDSGLKAIVYQVAANYGPVTVNSTCRNKGHNRAVGGAPKSKHLSGDAVDFRVRGNVGAVYAYLKGNGNVGGLKHYGGGLFHIDNGDRRSW